jgi:predicted phosphodiesterase
MRICTSVIVVIVALGTSTLAQHPCNELSNCPVRFAIIGDRTGGAQEGIYEDIVTEIEQLRPDFVMTVGDMIEGYISDTVEMNARWDEYFEIVRPLSMPIHYTPGNNDITSDVMEPAYRARVGEPNYSFDHRGLHFVVLDNSRPESFSEMDEKQIAWLKDDLAKNRDACYTLVFFHKPFWYRTLGEGKPDSLHEIFKANGVDAVFTGHFHAYFSAEFDGILYTSMGSSGGSVTEGPEGVLYHFGWVTVDSGGIHIAPIKKDAVLPWDIQTLAQRRAYNTVRASSLIFSQLLPLTEAPSGELTSVGGSVTVTLHNPIVDTEWNDTLRWDLPDGWTITPPAFPYTLAVGATVTVQFVVSPAATLYPLPKIVARLLYGKGCSTEVTRELEVARMALCVKVKEPVVIDGQLNENCWSRPVTSLFKNDGTPSTQDSAAFYFAYDKDNLYVGAYCHESQMDQLRAVMTERDAAVYTEDAVGLMFQPEPPFGAACQIYVNPLGTICDQLLERASDGYWSGRQDWNGEIEVKTLRGSDYYSVEMRIPLAQFVASGDTSPNSDDRWRVNFRRKQARLNASASFQVPWQYEPRSYGELVFE